ncbi:RagB/SusD family nutrient uptake outer membrane protein [Flavobacteriaceae bacterium F08102]|nr:RagB/SusD family nutrient uptake outer membrane protein [Flavobacteriaceae bacterium F08102]
MKNITIKLTKILQQKATIALIAVVSILSVGCEEFIEIDTPRDQIATDKLFSTDLTATAAMNGIYSEIERYSSTFNGELEQYLGMASDEVETYDFFQDIKDLQANNILAENSWITGLWNDPYRTISSANLIIENVKDNPKLSSEVRDQLHGEALFFRAFAHFHLVNIYGPVPYANTSNVHVLNEMPREPVETVYTKIIADLIEAKSLMLEDYSHAGNERVRANKSAAEAMLAKAYLYTEQWDKAEIEATAVITNPMYEIEPNLNDVFLANSKETILKLNNEDEQQTAYGQIFVMSTEGFAGSQPPGRLPFAGSYPLTEGLLNAFETGDLRLKDWVGIKTYNSVDYYFPYKYKKTTWSTTSMTGPNEEFTLFRLAEQYLIRAEARAQQDNIPGAQADLNKIRNRAGLLNTTANDKASLLDAIAHERRIELMLEGGNRWYDLKRTGKIDAVMGPLKTDWESTDAFFPIPPQEIIVNDNLTQNEGYY